MVSAPTSTVETPLESFGVATTVYCWAVEEISRVFCAHEIDAGAPAAMTVMVAIEAPPVAKEEATFGSKHTL
jgi:hypothetical protein